MVRVVNALLNAFGIVVAVRTSFFRIGVGWGDGK